MKKERKSVTYESPHTRGVQVCLESGICGGSANVENPSGDSGKIEEHKNVDFEGSWNGGSWDS